MTIISRAETANASVEMVFTVPLYMLILTLSVDMSMAFVHMNQVWDATRETTRRLSTEGLTATQAPQFALDMIPFADQAQVTVHVTSSTEVAVEIQAPYSDFATIGVLPASADWTFKTLVVMRREL